MLSLLSTKSQRCRRRTGDEPMSAKLPKVVGKQLANKVRQLRDSRSPNNTPIRGTKLMTFVIHERTAFVVRGQAVIIPYRRMY
jgi:hypothetical protein